MKHLIYFTIIILLFSCATKPKHIDRWKLARKLYEKGMDILLEKNSLTIDDSTREFELNRKALEKFETAYNADTTYEKAVLLASECTMYARDYRKCIYWTSKLMRLDTSRDNVHFSNDRIEYCNKHL